MYFGRTRRDTLPRHPGQFWDVGGFGGGAFLGPLVGGGGGGLHDSAAAHDHAPWYAADRRLGHDGGRPMLFAAGAALGEAVPGDIAFWGAYTFVIIFGTVLSFSLYLMSTTYIAPAETSLLGAVEPVVSVLFSLWLFSFLLNGWELFGMALILGTVIVVTRG